MIEIKQEISLNGIVITAGILASIVVQLVGWAWFEAKQTSTIEQMQVTTAKHYALDAHLGAERRMAGLEARQLVTETNLLTTNKILGEIRADIRALLYRRQGHDEP